MFRGWSDGKGYWAHSHSFKKIYGFFKWLYPLRKDVSKAKTLWNVRFVKVYNPQKECVKSKKGNTPNQWFQQPNYLGEPSETKYILSGHVRYGWGWVMTLLLTYFWEKKYDLLWIFWYIPVLILKKSFCLALMNWRFNSYVCLTLHMIFYTMPLCP